MQAREATAADAELLLRWRNDPATVAWSRTPDPVTHEDHERWLAGVLADPDRKLLVLTDPDPVGTVRFDRSGDAWEVSITVAPEARGRGLSKRILAAGEATLGPARLLACVHRDNAASLALFRRAGYLEDHTDGEHEWFAKQVR